VSGPAFLGAAFRAAFPSGFGPTAITLTGTNFAAGATVTQGSSNALMARMFGQQMGGSTVTFVLDNAGELREQAYQKAIEEARSRAKRLAALADVKLGPVVSVQEVPAMSGSDGNAQMSAIMAIYGLQQSAAKEDPRVTSDKFADIPLRVTLQVRFAIEKN